MLQDSEGPGCRPDLFFSSLPAPLGGGMSSSRLSSLIPQTCRAFLFFQDGDSFIGILILKVPHVQS